MTVAGINPSLQLEIGTAEVEGVDPLVRSSVVVAALLLIPGNLLQVEKGEGVGVAVVEVKDTNQAPGLQTMGPDPGPTTSQEEVLTSNGAITVVRVEPGLRNGAMRSSRAANGAAMIRLEAPSSSNGVLVAAAVLLVAALRAVLIGAGTVQDGATTAVMAPIIGAAWAAEMVQNGAAVAMRVAITGAVVVALEMVQNGAAVAMRAATIGAAAVETVQREATAAII